MTVFTGPPPGATRNQPITDELKRVLDAAARAAGVDTVRITSGGQDPPGPGARRTGSTRHDHGRAADLQCVVGATTLTFTDQSAPPGILTFVTAAAAAGATGIGAGVGYMGNRTIHVGFGTSVSDKTRLTWGAGGRSATAPQWLRDAAGAGWAAPAPMQPAAAGADMAPGRYAVIARNGLKLRGGPGTNFASEITLPAGTELTLVEKAASNPAWARVDVQGDGLLDGYVFAAFLAPSGPGGPHQDALEDALGPGGGN
ncbi:SH3 domain-containing protein [Bradyrhizobium oligotrophicum]|uniref:SH3 domain-containing protein n=1 Tax=Bradyrhizobium oligotrophicum TaxID=44255 RepID=UPI003EBD5F40